MLQAEITEQGYTGGYNTLNRYVRPLRRLDAAQLGLASSASRSSSGRWAGSWSEGQLRCPVDGLGDVHVVRTAASPLSEVEQDSADHAHDERDAEAEPGADRRF